jgi:methyl-accepting chemotaxis protein PixJ
MVNRTHAPGGNGQARSSAGFPPPPPPLSPHSVLSQNGYESNELDEFDDNGLNGQEQSTLVSPPIAPTAPKAESSKSLLSKLRLLNQENKPLLQQMVTRLLPGVLVPLGVVSVISYVLTSQESFEEAREELMAETITITELTSKLVTAGIETSDIVANNPYVIAEARNASVYAEATGLVNVPIEQLEQRFGTTKQLRPNLALNSYFKQIVESSTITDFLLTDKHGFNIGYAEGASDFMQGDEPWWQKAKELGKTYFQQSFDESSNTLGFEIYHPIIDPNSQEFLGVMETTVPSEYFNRVFEVIKFDEFFETVEIQIVGVDEDNNLAPVMTLRKDGIAQEQEVIGSEALLQRLTALKTIAESGDITSAVQAASFPVEVIQHAEGTVGFESTMIDQGRSYLFLSVPNTPWIAVASVTQSEIEAESREGALLSLLTILIEASVLAFIIFQVARQLSKPLAQLTGAANQVAAGNLNIYATPEGSSETHTLANSFNNLVTRVKSLLQAQVAETERSQILRDVTLEITQANSPEAILTQFPINRVRQVLKSDRVLVYRLDETGKGSVIAESVAGNWPRTLGADIHDPCFEKGYAERYRRGRVHVVPNIYEAGLTECHLKMLEPFAVKASLVTPIRQGDQLVGLLIAHQCSKPRNWQKLEVDFFTQISTQLGLALERLDLINQTAESAEQARALAEDQRQQKEALQRQLIDLLSDVEGAASGDLTVRADVSAGEIGTVADFFNSIVESLRQIVTQVKQSAVQVNSSLGENEAAIRQLADQALKQAEETTRTLDSVEQMTQSIQLVADRAGKAAQVARTASETAEMGGAAMDLTVQNILNLRETVGETAKKVKRLGESSQQISKVISLINQIAMQTNLLAINAGIEAARAGEEGQGFAVVAEEVGELAARSAAATQEIERIVDSIQRETSQVVEAMEQSTAQVVEGTHRVEEAKQSLGQILEVSRQIDQLVQSISESTESQVQTSEAVAKLMQEVASVSEKTSVSSRQVSEALRQTVEVAQDLQESVEAFKVGV